MIGRLVLPGKVEDLARAGHAAANRLVAKRRQAPRQARGHQVEVIVAKPGRVAQPDGIDFLDHLLHRLRRRAAREGLGITLRLGRVLVVVVGNLRIRKGQDVEVIARLALPAEMDLETGMVILLDGVEVDGGVQVLGEVPGMAVALLRFAADCRRDHTDAVHPCRRLLAPGFAAGGNQPGSAGQQYVATGGRKEGFHAYLSGAMLLHLTLTNPASASRCPVAGPPRRGRWSRSCESCAELARLLIPCIRPPTSRGWSFHSRRPLNR